MSTVLAFLRTKAVRWTLLSIAGAFLAALIGIYAVSGWILSTTYDPPAVTLRTQEPASAERGARLALTFGCVGCHGTHGRILFEAPFVGRIAPPDLARAQTAYGDAELIALIRSGIKRDHTTTIEMPANALSSLADSDLADIIAWLRALKPDAETLTEQTTVGPVLRFLLLYGTVRVSAHGPLDPAPPASVPDTQLAHGEYLVKVACGDCHLLDRARSVDPGLEAPGLREITQAYDLAQFTRLMRDGKGAGERELELMSEVAREGFAHFTDAEIAAIHAYLNAPNASGK